VIKIKARKGEEEEVFNRFFFFWGSQGKGMKENSQQVFQSLAGERTWVTVCSSMVCGEHGGVFLLLSEEREKRQSFQGVWTRVPSVVWVAKRRQ
jgi:hypothetical protein